VHGGQGGPEKNKNYIIRETLQFMKDENIKSPKIFIVGDFNDRYDGITSIEIGDLILKYSGESPKSCCHNWDSSCESNIEMKQFLWPGQTGDYPNQLQCAFSPDDVKINGVKVPLPGERGHVKNYKYKGDKVFGEFPISVINMYHGQNGTGASIESDHELVYAYYSLARSHAGGRMVRKSRKSKKSKLKKQSKSKTKTKSKLKSRSKTKSNKMRKNTKKNNKK
jgi:hypothetical protein